MKKTLLTFCTFIIIGISVIYANFINFNKKVTFFDSISKNIITDSKNLNSNIIIFKSNLDISKYEINTSCKNEFKYIGAQETLHFFSFKLLDNKCTNPFFTLRNGKKIFNKSTFKLHIENKEQLFSTIIDYPTSKIKKLNKMILEKIQKKLNYKNINSNLLKVLKKRREYEELVYKQKIISTILNRRNSKYSLPVKGYKLSTKLNEIPNAGRPYREHYTDGIHHGWDIIAPFGTPVSAIDDGIIIRIVKNFKYEDISNIQKKGKINSIQKLRNLDILRGNQIWLKTSKGDVIFYSHLDKVYNGLQEGQFISVGTDIGTIGKSGVPDKNYTNFHLHFPIQKNPYNIQKVGKYDWEDYMSWDWYLKGLNEEDVLEGQKKIFIEEVLEN